MTGKRLFLTLVCCTFISGREFARAQTNASVQKVKTQKATSDSLAEQFEKIKIGMTDKKVLEIMGEPKHKEGNVWTYALDRAPAPGEQLMIYQITFRDHKVTEKRIIGGPDATGPAPPAAH
jgi:hypothetical protein